MEFIAGGRVLMQAQKCVQGLTKIAPQGALWSGHILAIFTVFTILFSYLFLFGSLGKEGSKYYCFSF